MFNDPEYVTWITGYWVHVSKFNGGTLGESYSGYWEVTVMDGDVYLSDNDLLFTDTPKTHKEVARMAYDIVMESEQ